MKARSILAAMTRMVLCAIMVASLAAGGVAAATDEAIVNVAEAAASGTAAVSPGDTLAVDLTGYALPDQANIVVLQVYNNYYYHPIDAGRQVYLFSRDSGLSVDGAPEFTGLDPLDPVFVIIGREAYPGSLDAGAMISSASIMVSVGGR